MSYKLPIKCPSCESELSVVQLKCNHCETTVSGSFPLPEILQLSIDEQKFILSFFLASGSLKEMARQLNVSYPTVRNHLDDLIEKIKKLNIDEN